MRYSYYASDDDGPTGGSGCGSGSGSGNGGGAKHSFRGRNRKPVKKRMKRGGNLNPNKQRAGGLYVHLCVKQVGSELN